MDGGDGNDNRGMLVGNNRRVLEYRGVYGAIANAVDAEVKVFRRRCWCRCFHYAVCFQTGVEGTAAKKAGLIYQPISAYDLANF